MKDQNIKNTAVNEYFSWIEKTIRPESALYRAAHTYMEEQRAMQTKEHEGPFLTVVTRTQGRRPEMLTEMLLCLTAQSNTDFELLVMGHNLTKEQNALVSGLIADLPEWMREKTRLSPVNGGTRTTPLKEGFEAAKGKYIAVLDDDDLVFDHWVDTFYQMSLEHDGKVLHTYSIKQDWETVGGDHPDTPRAAGAPEQIYCRDFHLLDELRSNSCPLCALAFPAFAYHELGIHFDESLTTTEDWDYLMRTSFLTGVANSREVTFLYRIWTNAESSATIHKKVEWKKNYKKIVSRFNETPILAAPGALKDVIDPDFIDGNGLFNVDEAEMFFDDGEGFDKSKKWGLDLIGLYPDCRFAFVSPTDDAQMIKVIRFDPKNYGFLTMKDVEIRVVCADDSEIRFTLADTLTNGLAIEDRLVFIKNDPQIILTLPTPMPIKAVLVSCEIYDFVEDKDIDVAVRVYATQNRSIFYRALRKAYRGVKKIIKR
ncbi:MAG: hypothetical protein IJW16_00645 [Clostridia bacterium]|nr:hypothetical protein [Clostridia bacterium]